jgi:alkylresorcinol/alkylpyrone synthase
MPNSVKLLSIGTAVPSHIIDQKEAREAATAVFSPRYAEFSRLSKVFESSGIMRRFGVRPIDWYLKPSSWSDRNAVYVDSASQLFVQAAENALCSAGLSPADVDVIVTVSTTGIATPSIEAKVAQAMGFRHDVERVPVFGLGCAGGISGLALAAKLAASAPGCVVLMVAVETCTLAFRMDKLTKANVVATALFGDGAAACVVKAGADGIADVEMSGQYMWPDTLDIMGWTVEPEGLGVVFDRAIPSFVRANILPAMRAILRGSGLDIADVDRFAWHPGGAKVIESLEQALSLERGHLVQERAILSQYGNMSSPTVLFVLERLIAAERLPNRTVLTAMGPGFTMSCVSLRPVQ